MISSEFPSEWSETPLPHPLPAILLSRLGCFTIFICHSISDYSSPSICSLLLVWSSGTKPLSDSLRLLIDNASGAGHPTCWAPASAVDLLRLCRDALIFLVWAQLGLDVSGASWAGFELLGRCAWYLCRTSSGCWSWHSSAVGGHVCWTQVCKVNSKTATRCWGRHGSPPRRLSNLWNLRVDPKQCFL